MKKQESKKLKKKLKRDKYGMRLKLPINKVHKTKKDYKRKNKVKLYEIDQD